MKRVKRVKRVKRRTEKNKDLLVGVCVGEELGPLFHYYFLFFFFLLCGFHSILFLF